MAILVVSIVLAFAVSNYANAKAAVNGLSVLVGAFFNLSLVFLPKVSPLDHASCLINFTSYKTTVIQFLL